MQQKDQVANWRQQQSFWLAKNKIKSKITPQQTRQIHAKNLTHSQHIAENSHR